VYAFTGDGLLVALAPRDGKLLWQQSVFAGSDGEPADLIADYGMACSPLVAGDVVIVTAGAPNATVRAFDRKSGEPAWTAGKGDPAGYSSPAVLDVSGKRQLVAFTGSSALGIEPKDGTVLWRYPWVTDYGCNTATPVSVDGRVLLSSGENHGSVLLKFPQTASGKSQPQPVWDSQGSRSVLRSEWQTPVLIGGYLYGFDNVGSAGPVTHLTCVEAATGERKWQKLRFGKGNLIAADGKLFATTMAGELVVIDATPDEYRELGRKKVVGSTRQAPSLADGRLYVRDGRQVVCFDVGRR
jgi:outer membrane protein assembly factor BamB